MLKNTMLGMMLTVGAVSSTFANSVTIVDHSRPDVTVMTVRYQLAYRNNLASPVHLGRQGWLSLVGRGEQTVTVPTVSGYRYAGIKLLKVTIHDQQFPVKTVTNEQFPADFGVQRTCSDATSAQFPNGKLILGSGKDHHHEFFSCGVDNHGYIR